MSFQRPPNPSDAFTESALAYAAANPVPAAFIALMILALVIHIGKGAIG